MEIDPFIVYGRHFSRFTLINVITMNLFEHCLLFRIWSDKRWISLCQFFLELELKKPTKINENEFDFIIRHERKYLI